MLGIGARNIYQLNLYLKLHQLLHVRWYDHLP